MRRQAWVLFACGVLMGTSGCDDGRQTLAPRAASQQRQPEIALADALAPSFAASLDRSGRFPTEKLDREPGVEITAARAAELAVAFARDFAPFNRSLYERATGRILRFDALTASPRVFFAKSAHGALSSRFSRATHKAAGGYYLVTLTQDGVAVLSVAVSALASDLRLREGHIVAPSYSGNEFRVAAIPPGVEYPLTPERASRIASEGSGARVTAMPDLVAPRFGTFAPQYSRWRVRLDRRVAVGGGRSTDTLYVDWAGGLGVTTSADGIADVARVRLAPSLRRGALTMEAASLPGRPGFGRHFVTAHVRVEGQ